ncbi:MAG: ATP-binding cassette domain-containing protein [Anaerolineae bacterium]|nr:ATP-binding cassette domain-containing protein [Anaerolineae bacterium]
MISFDRVTYRYPGTQAPVLQELSFDVEEGEFLLVMGPSGSGKSTLLRCLNGLVPHFYGGTINGRVQVAGRDPIALGPRGMADAVGFVFQDPEAQFIVDKVEDEIAFALENAAIDPLLMRKRVEEALDQLGIAHLRSRSVNTLSGGERQRVAIAAVMTLQPRILVLDEPTSQLDPQAAEEVLDGLVKLNQDLGLTVILSEHRLERVIQHIDRILYLPGDGQPPIVGDPRTVLGQVSLTPPLVTLAKALGWSPLPLTIKEGRQFVKQQGAREQRSRGAEEQGAGTQVSVPTSTNVRRAPVISVEGLSFSYNGHRALSDVSLEVGQGEFVAVMGRNGAGKTTLLMHLVGLLKPNLGRVRILSARSPAALDTRQAAIDEIIRVVGYVPQNPNALLFSDTVREEIAFTRRNHGLLQVDDTVLLEHLGLAAHASRYPRDLSVGERQRVAVAAILAAEPQILLLDEPTRGLDYQQKEALVAFLEAEKARGRTIIMSTHDVELAARCADRVVLLSDGQVVVDGPARQVMSESLIFSSQINKLFRDPALLTVEDVLRLHPPPNSDIIPAWETGTLN